MGFKCDICGKDFGTNKEWFEDHKKAHFYDQRSISKIVVTKIKEQNEANLKNISNAIKSGKIRIWMDFDGFICIENTKTKNMIRIEPCQDLQDFIVDDAVI